MLHYTRTGKGTGDSLVLIHGFLGAKEIFQEVNEELSSHFDVISVDLPGHGKSKLEKENYSVYDYAKSIAEVLQHENIQESIWLGHSLGGYITLAAIEGEIANIKRAILAYSSDSSDTDEQREKRTKQQLQIPEIGVKNFVDSIIGNFFSDNANEEMINVARKIAYEATQEGLIVALEAMKTRPNQQQFVEQTTTPILVIEGSKDKVVKSIQSSNPNVQKTSTNSGHLGMLEDPKNFLNAIKV